MGMFKSIREIQSIAKETEKTWDANAQRRSGMARMAGAQEMLAQQTRAANLQATGIDATASVVEVRSTGAMINMQSVVEIDLTVLPGGLPPYPVTVKQPVAPFDMPKIQPGGRLAIKLDASDPSSVWINFFGSV